VAEYHSIISDFEIACDNDFSPLKILDSDLHVDKHKPTFSYYEPPIAEYKYCDALIFRGKVFGLLQYIVSITDLNKHKISPPPTPPLRNVVEPKTIAPTIYIGSMQDSQFVHSSPNASIKNRFNAKGKPFIELIQEIKSKASELNLDETQQKQMDSDLATIETQIEAPASNYTIIRESMFSIRSIIQGISANLLTNGLLLAINHFFGT